MPPRIEIIGDAEKAAPFIIWAKREWYLREGRWVKHTGACLIELFRAGDTGLIRIIPETVADTGIIFHPRSGEIKNLTYTEYVSGPYGSMPETKHMLGVAGGWANGTTELNTEYIYPLIDEDNASFVVTNEDGLGGSFAKEDGNYGNLYWWDGTVDDPIFLSWKGTPTRHFRLPGNIQIPGFSTFETSSAGLAEDTPIYTAFGTKLYQSGSLLADAPKWSWPCNPTGVDGRCLILGACVNKTSGSIYMVCQADYYNAPENVFIFSDGKRVEGSDSLKAEYLSSHSGVTIVFEKALTKTGIHTIMFKYGGPIDGWSFVGSFQTGRIGLPYFANEDGTDFLCSNGDSFSISGSYVAKNKLIYGTYRELVGYSGSIRLECSPEILATYANTDLFEYKNNESASANIVLNYRSITQYQDKEPTYKHFGFDWDEVVQPNDPVVNMSMEPGTNTSYVTIYGGMLPLSSNVGYFTNDRTLNFTGLCGTQNVTVTDACGLSLDLGPRRMPLGYWSYTITCGTQACGGAWECSSKYLKPDCTWYDTLGYYLEDDSYMGSVTLNTGSAACIENPCDGSLYGHKGNIYQKFWLCP